MGPLESWDLQSLQNTQCQPPQYCFLNLFIIFLRISRRHTLYFDHAHPCNLLPKSFHIHGTPPLPISCLLLINNILNPVCAAPMGKGVRLLFGAWPTYQGPHFWRKQTLLPWAPSTAEAPPPFMLLCWMTCSYTGLMQSLTAVVHSWLQLSCRVQRMQFCSGPSWLPTLIVFLLLLWSCLWFLRGGMWNRCPTQYLFLWIPKAEDLIRSVPLALWPVSHAADICQTTNRYWLPLGTVSSPGPLAVSESCLYSPDRAIEANRNYWHTFL